MNQTGQAILNDVLRYTQATDTVLYGLYTLGFRRKVNLNRDNRIFFCDRCKLQLEDDDLVNRAVPPYRHLTCDRLSMIYLIRCRNKHIIDSKLITSLFIMLDGLEYDNGNRV